MILRQEDVVEMIVDGTKFGGERACSANLVARSSLNFFACRCFSEWVLFGLRLLAAAGVLYRGLFNA